MSECIICYESCEEKLPECKHIVHRNCLKQHFKPECPLCRRKLDIIVEGERPEVYIPIDYVENEENSYTEFLEQLDLDTSGPNSFLTRARSRRNYFEQLLDDANPFDETDPFEEDTKEASDYSDDSVYYD